MGLPATCLTCTALTSQHLVVTLRCGVSAHLTCAAHPLEAVIWPIFNISLMKCQREEAPRASVHDRLPVASDYRDSDGEDEH
jgi:hypothetical protein